MLALRMRQFFGREVTSEQVWQLFGWCLAHGADEFTVSCSGDGNAPWPFCDEVEERLRPFSVQRDEQPNRWRLTAETVDYIHALFPDGLLADPTFEETGWVEDLRCYRDGAGMFWAINHEAYGFLQLTEDEHRDVQALGIETHPVHP